MPCSPTPGARKKRRIRRRLLGLPDHSVVLAEDETELRLFPPLRAAWSLKGHPSRVRLSGRNDRRVIFGAMNLMSGCRLFLAREDGRAPDSQAFLRRIHDFYRRWHVALVLDENPSHTAGRSTGLAEELGIDLLWLPNRAPELNPMDTLWGQGKDVISANRQDVTIDIQADRFIGFLSGLSDARALHTAGVLSGKFWLKRTLSKKFCGPA